MKRMVEDNDADEKKKPKTVKRKPGKQKTLAQTLKEAQIPGC